MRAVVPCLLAVLMTAAAVVANPASVSRAAVNQSYRCRAAPCRFQIVILNRRRCLKRRCSPQKDEVTTRSPARATFADTVLVVRL
jgi:hypothetical protein